MTLLRISSLLVACAIAAPAHAQTLTPDFTFTGKTVQSEPRSITRWISDRYNTGSAQTVQVEAKAAILKMKDGSEKTYTCDQLDGLAAQDLSKVSTSAQPTTYLTPMISALNQTELDKAWRGAGCITNTGNKNSRFIRAPKLPANAPVGG